MGVNNIRVEIRNQGGVDLQIPIEQVWDFQGQQQAIETYEESIISEILNKDEDFEVTRFEHKEYDTNKSSLNYEFYLWDTTSSPSGSYSNSYTPKFTVNQIYYYQTPFTKSFWKLDLYTSPFNRDQQAYITIILPVQQGFLETQNLNGTTQVEIKKPKYSLDYIGDKEGFFIYWLKKRDFINVDEFYMTAKFFDGSTGQFVKMMNRPQNTVSNQTDFPPDEYFYYRVKLDYPNQKYEMFEFPVSVLAGTTTNPIKWYEYVNP
jgi:hypothetical protein